MVLVAACGSAPASSPTPSKTATPAPTSTAATPAATSGGTIVDGIFEEPNQLNPVLGPSMTYQQMVEQVMFSGLVKVTPEAKILPDLATEVPTQQNGGISKDNLTYTFHLRTDAKWSDGVPFTAQDVVFTWKTVMNKDVIPLTTQGFSDIASMDTPDPHTVVMHLKRVYAPFLTTWSGPVIIPEHTLGKLSGAQIMKAAYNHKPTVTLGPFEFKQWVPADHITVVPDPYYFGGHPKTSQIVFKVIPDQNAQLAALQNGEINVYYFAPITQLAQLKGTPGADVHVSKQAAWEFLVINMKNPILQDKNVRMAIEYAINKQVLVHDVWQGLAVPMGSDQPPASWAYDPNIPVFTYDPKKADSLLDAAGWKMGSDGYRHKNGKILALVDSTTAKNPWRQQSQKIDQETLKQVGIKLIIRNYDSATFFGTVLRKGNHGQTGAQGGFDLAEFETQNSYDPDPNVAHKFACNYTPDKGGQNYGWFCDPKVDQLLSQEESLTDPAQRKPIFWKISQRLHDDAAAVFMYSPEEIDVSRGITGYQPNVWNVDTWNTVDWALKGK